MTTTMHDELDRSQPISAAMLTPGSLVYLWPAGDRGGSPVLVRVDRATVHEIQGRDLSSKERGSYDVSDSTPPAMRWTWELAAGPENPLAGSRVKVIDLAHMTREERLQLLLGEEGKTLLFHLVGQTSVTGVVTTVVCVKDRPVVVFVASLPDSIREWVAKIPVDKIAQIMEVESA